MCGRIILCITICLSFFCRAEAGMWEGVKNYIWGSKASHPKVKVLIVNDQPGASVEIKGKYKLFDPNTRSHISTRFIGKKNIFQSFSQGLKWGEEFPDVYQILILPDNHKVPVFVDGREYRGPLYVYNIGNSISIVNEVALEDYIASILAEQFHSSIPEEALAAVVIAARTNALFQIEHPKNPYWTVDATRVDYPGHVDLAAENPIAQTVQNTRHMVMSMTGAYEGKATPFPAIWGSSTGGKAVGKDAVHSRISLFEAEDLAEAGENAAEILKKAFPNTTIQLAY